MQAASQAYEAVVGTKPTIVSNEYRERRDGSTMKALCWEGKDKVELKDMPRPAITDPGDAIIRVTGTTVCGSDLHLFHGEIPNLVKHEILGHESCGIVDEVGPDCHLKRGQRVVVSFQIACGQCEYCKKGLSTACDFTNKSSLMEKLWGHKLSGIFGYSHLTGGYAGGQAEYLRIPIADVNCLPLPDDVPDEKGLYLSDIIPTSYHACVDCGIQAGDIIGVWGLGPIGLFCVEWAFIMGASKVVAIDWVPERLEMARRLGADTINFTEEDPVKLILEKYGGLDRAIDCAGFRYAKSLLHKVERAVGLETDTSENLNEMIQAVKKFGTISIIADYAGYTNHFLIGAVMEKGIRLIGAGQAPIQKYWQDILNNYLRTGKLDHALSIIVTHRFRLEDIDLLYKRFDTKEQGIVKTFIQTRFSAPPALGTPQLSKLV